SRIFMVFHLRCSASLRSLISFNVQKFLKSCISGTLSDSSHDLSNSVTLTHRWSAACRFPSLSVSERLFQQCRIMVFRFSRIELFDRAVYHSSLDNWMVAFVCSL